VTIRWPSGLVQTLKDVPAGRLDVDEPIALDLPRRSPVGAPLIGQLTFVDGIDPGALQITASDGAPVQIERVSDRELRFILDHTDPGLITFSFTLAGTTLAITPRVTRF
jgi:hypothetical protein